jgi:hypothetical protein
MEAVQKIVTKEALELAKDLDKIRSINIMRAGDESEDGYCARINIDIYRLNESLMRAENIARLLMAIKAAAIACALNAGAQSS